MNFKTALKYLLDEPIGKAMVRKTNPKRGFFLTDGPIRVVFFAADLPISTGTNIDATLTPQDFLAGDFRLEEGKE
jgi:hypothetical protein